MANTYTSLHYHFTFSTRHRQRWIHDTFPDLSQFAWQDGYGAFTVSKSGVPDVTVYIENQREHHRTRTYQEEYRALLDRHGIEFDERYIWD